MPKTKNSILILACVFILAPAIVFASEVKTGNSVYVAKDQTVDGNLYSAGQNITIDGIVKGDVICAGQSITVNGEVEGSVICAGQSVSVNGKVKGSVRVIGNTIGINGEVGQNVMAAGSTVDLGPEGKTGWDMLAASGNTDIRGSVGRDLLGAGAQVNIFGKVEKNVKLYLGAQKNNQPEVVVGEKALIGGDLVYHGYDEAEIKSGAKISGKVTRNEPVIKKDRQNTMLAWMRAKLYSVFSALIIGLVLISLWRKPMEKITDLMLEKAGATFGWGLAVLFLSPIIVIALIITIIGLPLAFILFSAWLAAMIVSAVITGILVGRSLLDKFWKKEKDSIIWAMVIGVLATQVIFAIPIVGWILSFLAMLWGLGGLFLYFKKQ